MDAITGLRNDVSAVKNQLEQQKDQIKNLLNHQLLPSSTSNNEMSVYNSLPLNGIVL